MEIVAIILALGASFALGMYVITQIEKDIDKRTGSDYDVEPEFAKRKGFKCTQNEKLFMVLQKLERLQY